MNEWMKFYEPLKQQLIAKAKAKNPNIDKELAEITALKPDDPQRSVKIEDFISKYGDIFLDESEQKALLNDQYDTFHSEKEKDFQGRGINTKTEKDPTGRLFGMRHLFYLDQPVKQSPPEKSNDNFAAMSVHRNQWGEGGTLKTSGSNKIERTFSNEKEIQDFYNNPGKYIPGLKKMEGADKFYYPDLYKKEPDKTKPQEKPQVSPQEKPAQKKDASYNQSIFQQKGGVSNWWTNGRQES